MKTVLKMENKTFIIIIAITVSVFFFVICLKAEGLFILMGSEDLNDVQLM